MEGCVGPGGKEVGQQGHVDVAALLLRIGHRGKDGQGHQVEFRKVEDVGQREPENVAADGVDGFLWQGFSMPVPNNIKINDLITDISPANLFFKI